MAILVRKNNQKIYLSSSGAVSNREKKIADKIDRKLNESLKTLERKWLSEGLLTSKGVKKNALLIWYELGKSLNQIIDQYKVRGTNDEPFFWQSIYGHVSPIVQRNPAPKRSLEWKRNHFRLCAKMAERSWNEVNKVGTWSEWRDIFDNAKILEDDRVLDWVVKTISNSSKRGHKELRPFIHATRRRLTKIDTTILSEKELSSKLDDINVE